MTAQLNYKEIGTFFLEDPTFIGNLESFSQQLGIYHADFKQLEWQYTNSKISGEGLFSGILHKWITQQSQQPTLRKLLEILATLGFKYIEGLSANTAATFSPYAICIYKSEFC